MKQIVTTLLVITFFVAAAQDPWKNIYRESAWAERDTWQRSKELIKFLDIKEGSEVGDIGCHEGYMSIKLSKEVGGNGKVYAVDISQGKLDLLKRHLDEREIDNVQLVKGDFDNPKLPLNQLDAVIILDTYHEMEDHDEILQHIKAALKTGGRLVLCEPISEERKNLQRSEQEKKHELGMSFALEDLNKAGFQVIYQKDSFIDRSKIKGDMMWIVVAKKN